MDDLEDETAKEEEDKREKSNLLLKSFQSQQSYILTEEDKKDIENSFK